MSKPKQRKIPRCSWCRSKHNIKRVVFPAIYFQTVSDDHARQGYVCEDCEANIKAWLGDKRDGRPAPPKVFYTTKVEMSDEATTQLALLKLCKEDTLVPNVGLRTFWFTMLYVEERVSSAGDDDA